MFGMALLHGKQALILGGIFMVIAYVIAPLAALAFLLRWMRRPRR